MPRRSEGPRLVLSPARAGRARLWHIRDGQRTRGTGCGIDDRDGAEGALSRYLAEKHAEAGAGRNRDPAGIATADIIAHYARARYGTTGANADERARLVRLINGFPGPLSNVTGDACRAFVQRRGSESSGRRDLESLKAAITLAWREGVITYLVPVWLPPKSSPRENWITRDQAAALLWAAWRMQAKERGGEPGRYLWRHVARFILVALYTGTRAGAVCGAAIRPTVGRGYVDLDRGVLFRRAPGSRETKKRQPPVSLPDRLIAHLRRWERLGISEAFVVEWRGRPVKRIGKAFATIARAAGVPEITPHALRHTAGTWLAMNICPPAEAADYLGMSLETYMRHYRHFYPDHQERARNAISRATDTQQQCRNMNGTDPRRPLMKSTD